MQTNTTGLCGEDPQCSSHTGFATARGGCVCFPRPQCSGSRLLYRAWSLHCMDFPGLSCSDSGFRVLHKSTDSVGPAFCAFPAQVAQAARSLTLPGCSAPYPLGSPSLSFHARQSGVPCVCFGELASSRDPPADVNHPESQEVFG